MTIGKKPMEYMRFRIEPKHAEIMRQIANEQEDVNLSDVYREAVKVYLFGRGYKEVLKDCQ